jgi:WD40 repeat protein
VTAPTQRPSLETRWLVDIAEPPVALDLLPGRGSRRGALLAGGSEGRVSLVEPEGLIRWERGLDSGLLDVAASPDGTRIAAVGMTGWKTWDADGQELRAEAAEWSSCATWDERSEYLALAEGKRLRVLDRDGLAHWSSAPLSSTVTGALWPRGRLRVAASAYQGVTIFEPASDRVTKSLRAPGAISGMAASPNGRWIVGGSQDATLHGWKVDDGSDFRMAGFPSTVSRLAFEDAGRWMACESSDVLTCWDFSGKGPTGRAAVVLTGHRSPVPGFAWAPGESRTLVSGDRDGLVLVWRLTAGTRPGDELRPVATLRGEEPVTAIVVDRPDKYERPTAYIARRSGGIDAVAIG